MINPPFALYALLLPVLLLTSAMAQEKPGLSASDLESHTKYFDISGDALTGEAAINGNKSLHINFGTRYYTDTGKEIDTLEDTKGFLYRFHGLAQMGRRDKWTVIDPRPLREAVFDHRKFKLDDVLIEIF